MFRIARTARLSRHVLSGMAVAGLGAGLSLAALPVAVASLIEASGSTALKQIHSESAVEELALRGFIRSREAAARWSGSPRAYTGIALGRVLLTRYIDSSLRRENLALAEQALARGLSFAPMDPYAWLRLVQVRTMRGAAAADIAPPLRLALRSGPNEDRRDAMLLLTLEAGLRAWDHLDGAQRRLIVNKAREAWRRNALATAAAGVRAGETERLARLLGL